MLYVNGGGARSLISRVSRSWSVSPVNDGSDGMVGFVYFNEAFNSWC